MPSPRRLAMPLLIALAAIASCANAQDTRTWLESQGLESSDVKTFEDIDVAVAHAKGSNEGQKVVVLRQGKPLWQTGPKDAEPGSKWTIQSVGRDLDGDGHPDAHVVSFSGGAHCCTTHHIVRLKPQVKRIAVHNAGNVGGSDFVDIPGRKAPVMISADDASAAAFAPYATSYFPLVVLEISPRGRLQFVRDLMLSKLPGQPPPVCATQAPTANAWLRERCAEYTTMRRQERVAQVKARLESVKQGRAVDRLKWEDYFDSGALGLIAAEINRYAYTGHGNAGVSWLETVWPGNDPVKQRLVSTLRQTHAKSVFAEDLKALATR